MRVKQQPSFFKSRHLPFRQILLSRKIKSRRPCAKQLSQYPHSGKNMNCAFPYLHSLCSPGIPKIKIRPPNAKLPLCLLRLHSKIDGQQQARQAHCKKGAQNEKQTAQPFPRHVRRAFFAPIKKAKAASQRNRQQQKIPSAVKQPYGQALF